MVTEMTTKRGLTSALYACPMPAATSPVERQRARQGAVVPFQGTGLPFAGNAPLVVADLDAPRTIQQLVPTHPGDTAPRPPV